MNKESGRRRFLACVGSAGVLGGAPLGGGCSPDPGGGPQPDVQPFEAGAATDFSVPSLKVMYRHRAVIGRDTQGFYAMSSTCTHAACSVSAPAGGVCIPAGNEDLMVTLDVAPEAVVMCCACHNSRFDSNGVVRAGPAPRPLPHFRVTVEDGRVRVDPRVAVALTDRANATPGEGRDASVLD